MSYDSHFALSCRRMQYSKSVLDPYQGRLSRKTFVLYINCLCPSADCWYFADSIAVSVPCSVQNGQIIGHPMRWLLRNLFLWVVFEFWGKTSVGRTSPVEPAPRIWHTKMYDDFLWPLNPLSGHEPNETGSLWTGGLGTAAAVPIQDFFQWLTRCVAHKNAHFYRLSWIIDFCL